MLLPSPQTQIPPPAASELNDYEKYKYNLTYSSYFVKNREPNAIKYYAPCSLFLNKSAENSFPFIGGMNRFFLFLAYTICIILLHICIDSFYFLRYTICMKENYTYARTCVYNINYHIVWCTKYRRKVLTPAIETRQQTILDEIGKEKGFTVVMAEVGEQDHIHCFISAPPKLSVTDIARYLKGISGRFLFLEFPEIKEKLWKGHL